MHTLYASHTQTSNTLLSSPQSYCVPLDEYQVFTARGADALTFLHGQVTQDLLGLNSSDARLAGYCTAKGRLLATMVVWHTQQTVFVLLRRDLADTILKKLSMFIFRSKVKLNLSEYWIGGVVSNFENLANLQQAVGGALPTVAWQRVDLPTGTWIAAPSPAFQTVQAATHQDCRSSSQLIQRWWWIAESNIFEQQKAALHTVLARGDAQNWQCADLAAGLPWISMHTQDLFIPQSVNLDLIEGVSFNKGCYPGQEIVARSHYRGKVKRRMAYGTIDGEALPDASNLIGEDIYHELAEPCGRVINWAYARSKKIAILFEIALSSLNRGELHLSNLQGSLIELGQLPYPITE